MLLVFPRSVSIVTSIDSVSPGVKLIPKMVRSTGNVPDLCSAGRPLGVNDVNPATAPESMSKNTRILSLELIDPVGSWKSILKGKSTADDVLSEGPASRFEILTKWFAFELVD